MFACIYSRLSEEDYSLSLLWFYSVLPDFDILLPFLVHRGPTHSVILMTVLFVPLYMFYRKGIPYFIALLSHSLIGDLPTGYNGVQLLWPVSSEWISAPVWLKIHGAEQIVIEVVLFSLSLIHIYARVGLSKTKPTQYS